MPESLVLITFEVRAQKQQIISQRGFGATKHRIFLRHAPTPRRQSHRPGSPWHLTGPEFCITIGSSLMQLIVCSTRTHRQNTSSMRMRTDEHGAIVWLLTSCGSAISTDFLKIQGTLSPMPDLHWRLPEFTVARAGPGASSDHQQQSETPSHQSPSSTKRIFQVVRPRGPLGIIQLAG